MKFAAAKLTEHHGIGRVHRYPLAECKGVSPKRRKEMAARLGGEPSAAATGFVSPTKYCAQFEVACERMRRSCRMMLVTSSGRAHEAQRIVIPRSLSGWR